MKPILASLFLLVTGVPTYDLIWHPKAGQQLRYTLEVTGDYGADDFRIASEVILRVKDVKANQNYTLGTEMKGVVTRFGSVEEKLEDAGEEVEEYDSRGEPTKPTPPSDVDGTFGELLAQSADLSSPLKPVEVGEKWTKRFSAIDVLKLPAATITYELLEVRATDQRIKIGFDYRQKLETAPMTATGVIYVNGLDGSKISVESNLRNFRFSPEVAPGHAKVILKLKDQK